MLEMMDHLILEKLNPASVVIAAGTDIAILANAYGSNCGKICFEDHF